jgi:hypothetical protein
MYGQVLDDGHRDQLNVLESGEEWWEQYILNEKAKIEGFSYPL